MDKQWSMYVGNNAEFDDGGSGGPYFSTERMLCRAIVTFREIPKEK